MATVQLLSAVAAPNGQPTAAKATGTITTVAKANIVDGETFALDDGQGSCCVFVFDTDGVYVDPGGGAPRWRVDISAATSADDVRDAVITAINECAHVRITAASGGAATVTLTQDVPGPQGNTTIAEQVVDAGFVVAGFTGGTLSGVELGGLRYGRAIQDEGDATLFLHSTAGTGALQVVARLWAYSALSQRWAPHGTGGDGTKGLLNGGTPIGESIPDQIDHTELVSGISAYDRAYLEIEALDGAGTAVSAWMQSHR